MNKQQPLDDNSAKESLVSFENLPEPAIVKVKHMKIQNEARKPLRTTVCPVKTLY